MKLFADTDITPEEAQRIIRTYKYDPNYDDNQYIQELIKKAEEILHDEWTELWNWMG